MWLGTRIGLLTRCVVTQRTSGTYEARGGEGVNLLGIDVVELLDLKLDVFVVHLEQIQGREQNVENERPSVGNVNQVGDHGRHGLQPTMGLDGNTRACNIGTGAFPFGGRGFCGVQGFHGCT